MPGTKRQNERLVILFLVGIVAMNYPILSLFSKVRLYCNIPLLYLYLFFCWAVFIAFVAFAMEFPASLQDRVKMPETETEGLE